MAGGSTLYAFEAYDNGSTCTESNNSLHYEANQNKSVFTYELPTSDQDEVFNLRLEKSMLQDAPCMNHCKYFPRADGKRILVFSSLILFHLPKRCDFELYDPRTESWRVLPNILHPREYKLNYPHTDCNSIIVVSFAFIDTSVLLVQTGCGLSFTLDFYRGKKWVSLTTFRGPRSPYPEVVDPFVVIARELCLTSNYALDINSVRNVGYDSDRDGSYSKRMFDYEDSIVFPCKGYTDLSSCIAGFAGPRDCGFCTLRTGRNTSTNTKQVVLILQLYDLDLNDCKKKLCRCRRPKKEIPPLPGATMLKLLKFSYEEKRPFGVFNPISFSSIPPPLSSTF